MATRWIGINAAKKPTENEQVIVWHVPSQQAEIARYRDGEFTDCSGRDNRTLCNLTSVISAWRPLPTGIPEKLKQR